MSEKNSLEQAASAYLRSAMHQPVDWQQWGEAAFRLAPATANPIVVGHNPLAQ